MGGKIDREFLLSGHTAWYINIGGLLIRISGWSNADDVLEKQYSMANGNDLYRLHHLAMTVSDMD